MSAPITTNTITTEVTEVKTWLQKHERLIIVVLCLASGLLLANLILDHQADRDKAAATTAQQILTAQQATDKSLAAQVAQNTQQYQALVVQLSQQNTQLAQAAQTRTVVLQAQQKTDDTIPLPDLGNRWAQLANISPTAFTATTQGVSVTPEAARTTVTQLEEVPVLTQNLADQKTETANVQKELDGSNTINGLLVTQISGLKTEIVDDTKACSTEEASLKADARKGKFHWFGIGYGAGFVSGFAVHLFAK